jgi:8-oxo-dGTP pyrophosphatase MutT (NUDIX family)
MTDGADPRNQLKAEVSSVAPKGAKILRPRDAATLIILDQSGSAPRVLLGKRRMDLAFMAGKYVFPGGRVDRADRSVTVASELAPEETARLLEGMRGTPSPARARALAAAAVREAFEEAGLIIGTRGESRSATQSASWKQFYGAGYVPDLAPLRLIARAITPPGRTRRFDTRFFCVDAAAIAERRDISDGELSGLEWLTLDDARGLDIPRITRVVLEDLAEYISSATLTTPPAAVPFYFQRNGSFKRVLIRGEKPLD